MPFCLYNRISFTVYVNCKVNYASTFNVKIVVVFQSIVSVRFKFKSKFFTRVHKIMAM